MKESKRSKTSRAASITKIPPVKKEPHHSDFYQQFEGQLSVNVIQNELTAENYKEKFHHLLCWEEKEHERLLAIRCVLAVLSKLKLVFQELGVYYNREL